MTPTKKVVRRHEFECWTEIQDFWGPKQRRSSAKHSPFDRPSDGLDGLEDKTCRDVGPGDECSVRSTTHRLDRGVSPLGHEALAVGRNGVVLF